MPDETTRETRRGDAPRDETHAGRRGMMRRFLPLAGLAGVMLAVYLSGGHAFLSLSNLIRQRAALAALVEANLLLACATFAVVYVVAVALSFPGASLLTIMGGFLFGWLLGGTLTAVSATLGATVVFLIARTSLGSALRGEAGPFLTRMADGFRKDGFHYLLFLRLAPVFPFWLVNIAPALFDMRLRPYLVATFVGILPGTYAYAFIGTGLDSVIAAQEAADPGCAAAGTCHIEVSALVTGELVAAFAVLALAALVPVVVRRLRPRGGPSGES
ncbi:TVP38/TMEM64 family protein [Stappia sp.]|uniref:TVP38/TMEM64 family protein n=1 Tax=Stappia sp. TaxID=1870903 RepID=UPI0025F04B6E|nr:TVP38/TMEM64 family protein [Stappia sp.]